MPLFTVHFSHIVVNSADAGTTDESMVSRVFFDLDVDGKRSGWYYADLKQTAGSALSTESIEVRPPVESTGEHARVFNQNAFADHARDYFLSVVGRPGQSGLVVSASWKSPTSRRRGPRPCSCAISSSTRTRR